MDCPSTPHSDDLDATRTYHAPEAAASQQGPAPDQPDYVIKGKLGAGGMGVVYLAHNTLLGRDEVLKVIRGHAADRDGSLERFLREIRAVAQLHHANIVTAYSAVRRGESVVFAMEHVDGLDLARLVKSKGPLPVAHACYFAYQAALGLQHAHERGLVHRDIKPGNLMLAREGARATIKILDFGLARFSREDAGLTATGRALGTPHYMAPEQIADARSADIRADIYSLGATLYFLLGGRPPFPSGSVVEVFQAHVSAPPERLDRLRPEVPAELAAIVDRMLAKQPAQRFQTPAEVAEALAPFFKRGAQGPIAAGQPSGWEGLVVVDEPEGPRTAAGDEPPTAPAWLWPAAAAGLLLLGLLGAWLSGLFDSRRPGGAKPEAVAATETAEEPIEFPHTITFRPRASEPPDDAADDPDNSAMDRPADGPKPEPAATAASGAPKSETSDPPDFQPLFNGNDLTGWAPHNGHAADWHVNDGALTFHARDEGSLAPGSRSGSSQKKRPAAVHYERPVLLFAEHSYDDFVLRLEFRMSGPAAAGVVLGDLDRGDQHPRFAEFALAQQVDSKRRTGEWIMWDFDNAKRRGPAQPVVLKADGDWNRLEVESRAGALQLRLNGELVQYDRPVTLEGPRRIGLRGLSGDVRFRNIAVRGVPAGAPGRPPLVLGRLVYADDLSDPTSGWSRDDIDNGPGQLPFTRNYEHGLYFMQAPPNWHGYSAWNACDSLSQDFQFEAVGRVLGDDPRVAGGWMLIVAGPKDRGLQATIDRLGQLAIAPAVWGEDKYPGDPRRGPLRHNAIRLGHEWNELTLRVRRRRFEVFVNSAPLYAVDLDWDLTPARAQIALMKPQDPGTLRVEFDWIEVRELLKELQAK